MNKTGMKIIMINDHLWNPNAFCSAYAHEGENGYVEDIDDESYVLMLNSKWSPDKPNKYREHKVRLADANRYFKELG